MKKILLLLILPMFSGCVTYYTPEVVVENGMYYADEDPAYINNAYVSGSYIYAGAAWYPWRSMDYFYFGYYPYSYYSPWYYPYSYYSPGYYPHHRYAHHRYWRRHGDYCQPYNACGRGQHDRYVDNDHDRPTDRRNRGGEDEDGNEDPGNRRNGNRTGSYAAAPTRRYVSTAPSGYSGDQGVVIRSRGSSKPGKNRTQPTKSEPVLVTGVSPVTPPATQPDYRSRQDGREIRYRSSPKQGRSRTGPVDNRSPTGSAAVVVASTPVQSSYRSRQGGSEVRYRSGAKQGKSSTGPVRSGSPVRYVGISSGKAAVPVQGSGSRQSASHSSSGKSRSNKSTRPSSRSGSSGSVSRSTRSRATSSSTGRRSSSRSNSTRSRREN